MWLVRPITREDESLSSVFTRLSLENRLSPQDACDILFDTRTTRTRIDFDKLSPAGAIPVNQAADLDEEQAVALTFWRWDARLLPNMVEVRHNFDWLPPLPSRQDEALPLGYPRCPLCLETDKLPYARLSHRLAFVVCCPKHKTFLVSKCHACSQPLPFPNTEPFLCASCGADQRKALQVAPRAFLDAQFQLLSILDRGWVEAGSSYGAQYSFVFFRLLLWLCRLLTSKNWGRPLRQAVHNAGGAQSNIEENAFWYRGNERIYCLSALERARLLSSALWLWEDWPARFVDSCRKVGLFSHTILSYGRNPPFVLLDPVRESLLKPFYALCEAEVRSAKAYLHKQGKRASLTELQTLTGNKLHAQAHMGDKGRLCMPYGKGRYWKLDSIDAHVRASVKTQALTEGVKTAHWVERALIRALETNHG